MLLRNQLAAMQGTLHANHPCTYAAQKKECFASLLNGIWLTSDLKTARQGPEELAALYRTKCPKAAETLEAVIEDALTFLSFPFIGFQEGSCNNRLERLNKEIRRRTRGGHLP